MSNYWDYYCRTCKVSTMHDINHGDEILRSVAKVAPLIKALHEAEIEYLDITISGYQHSDFVSFLIDHADHELELHDEYGKVEPIAIEKKSDKQAEQSKQQSGPSENRHWRVEALYDCSLQKRVTYEGTDYQAMLAVVGELCLTVTVDKIFIWRDNEKYRHIEMR